MLASVYEFYDRTSRKRLGELVDDVDTTEMKEEELFDLSVKRVGRGINDIISMDQDVLMKMLDKKFLTVLRSLSAKFSTEESTKETLTAFAGMASDFLGIDKKMLMDHLDQKDIQNAMVVSKAIENALDELKDDDQISGMKVAEKSIDTIKQNHDSFEKVTSVLQSVKAFFDKKDVVAEETSEEESKSSKGRKGREIKMPSSGRPKQNPDEGSSAE